MIRLLFEKRGNAIYISHLDLMRMFQRAFQRAGLHLTHTQGFKPRPSVSIALPLPVGMESVCELLDFDISDESCDYVQMQNRLNPCLIDGVKVLDVYGAERKTRDIAFLSCSIFLHYDSPVADDWASRIEKLFSGSSLILPKKTQNGVQEQEIIPMIRSFSAARTEENTIACNAVVCCQNPALNPMQLVAAIERYAPELKPDFAAYCRTEIYDNCGNAFR